MRRLVILCAVALASTTFRRGGFALTREPIEIRPDEITRPQFDQLMAEPLVSLFVKSPETGEGMALDHLSAESIENFWTQFQSGAGGDADDEGGAPPSSDAEPKGEGTDTSPPSVDPGAGVSTAAVEMQESRSGTDGREALQSAPTDGENQPVASPSPPVAASDTDKPAGRKAKA